MVVTSGTTRRARPLLGVVALAIFAVIASACRPPASAPAPSGAAAPSVVATINGSRGAAPALAVNDALTNLAADWANHLAMTGTLEHRDLNSVGGWSTLGETIFVGPCGSADAAIVNAWLGSPSHAAVLLSPAFTSAGVARICAPSGREWVVADFGG